MKNLDPHFPQIKDGKMVRFTLYAASSLICGRLGFAVHFILSKIVDPRW